MFFVCALCFTHTLFGAVHAAGVEEAALTFRQSPKAMWVWNAKIFQSQGRASALIEFCRAHAIHELFISAYHVKDPLARYYQDFNRRAHEQNIKVYALAGDPRWGLSQYHSLCLGWVKEVIAFNKAGSTQESFDGISLDVEVYLLSKQWETQTARVLGGFLDLQKRLARLIEDDAPALIFGEALPFWFDDDATYKIRWNDRIQYPAHHILDWVDYVAIMDYRNYAEGQDGIIKLAKSEIEYANTAGKKIYIGVETQKDIFPKYITFGSGSFSRMEEELNKVVRYYRKAPSFAGIAVHHYESYKEFAR